MQKIVGLLYSKNEPSWLLHVDWSCAVYATVLNYTTTLVLAFPGISNSGYVQFSLKS